jgi:hypothetical protein
VTPPASASIRAVRCQKAKPANQHMVKIRGGTSTGRGCGPSPHREAPRPAQNTSSSALVATAGQSGRHTTVPPVSPTVSPPTVPPPPRSSPGPTGSYSRPGTRTWARTGARPARGE